MMSRTTRHSCLASSGRIDRFAIYGLFRLMQTPGEQLHVIVRTNLLMTPSSTSPRSGCSSTGLSSARSCPSTPRARCAARSTSSRPARPRCSQGGGGQSDIHRRTGRDDDAGIGLWFRVATPHGVPRARNESAWRFGAPEQFSPGADAPWTPARGKEAKTQDSIQRPGNSETEIAAAGSGGVPDAIRGTHEPRILVPRATAQHPA